jgi:MerR family Zn(II)-responsive transcriptional regulator of zntA
LAIGTARFAARSLAATAINTMHCVRDIESRRMFTIGKLAARTGVSNDTLRFYEQEELIKPAAKSPVGYRLYDEQSAQRITFIKHAQACGFTLGEIRALLALRTRDRACCGDVRKRAIEKKLQIERRIRAMQAMSKALDQLIADCADETQPVEECTIIAALEKASPSTPVP